MRNLILEGENTKEIKNETKKQQLMDSSGYSQQFSTDMISHTRLFRIEAGEYAVREGERPDYLFYLAQGRAKLYVTMPSGRVSFIDFFTFPCFIGEMELLNEEFEVRAVQAIEISWCLALRMKQHRNRLLNDVILLHSLCILLSVKNYRNTISATQNQSFPLTNCLAAFILLIQNEGVYQEKHTQVAEYLGVSYRHLFYVLVQFQRDGLIGKQGGGYLIRESRILAGLAREMVPDGEQFL